MADLTTTITETVTLNGSLRGSSNVLTTTGIGDVYERIVTCVTAQETTVVQFGEYPYSSVGAVDVDRAKYIRITNLDTTEDVEVAFVTAATNYQVTVLAGNSHILSKAEAIALGEEDTTPSFGTMEDLVSIIVKPTGAADVRCEVFIAVAE